MVKVIREPSDYGISVQMASSSSVDSPCAESLSSQELRRSCFGLGKQQQPFSASDNSNKVIQNVNYIVCNRNIENRYISLNLLVY